MRRTLVHCENCNRSYHHDEVPWCVFDEEAYGLCRVCRGLKWVEEEDNPLTNPIRDDETEPTIKTASSAFGGGHAWRQIPTRPMPTK